MADSPNEAIFFVLPYLPLFELLAMAQVCKSLRDAVKNDTLPWLKIIVDRPLNRRLSDDRLVEVASMAEGRLQILLLINCINITDHGLFRVVAHNPHISKLHIPGCTRLTPGGIVRAVQLLTKGNHRLKSLRIKGIYNLHEQDLRLLLSLIPTQEKKRGKIFYHNYNKSPTTETDSDSSPIDVDICPLCHEVRMVFDCPEALCEKQQRGGECRGCGSCIARCIECGMCVQQVEAACCADALCLGCWLKLPKCNFCNNPYCTHHAYQQHTFSESAGFICATCHSRFY